MSKLKTLLFTIASILSLTSFAQSGPAAPSAGNWLLIDTTYTVGTSVANQTKARITYKNTTSTKVTGVQFRTFYDKVAFKSPTVALVSPDPNLNLQYVVDTTSGYITITLVYVGSSSTYTLPNAETFEITFNHATATTFQYLTAIDSMKFTGTQIYGPVASKQSGMDTTLSLYSYGGAFYRPRLKYHGRFINVTGTGTRNLTVSLEKKPKVSGTWSIVSTKLTDTAGKFAFDEIVDTTYWAVRLEIKGDTMSLGNVVSVADAQKVNQFILGTAVPQSWDYYSSDVNGDFNVTISDAYVIFGRMAGRFTSWVNNVKDVRFFTPSEYNTITSNPGTNYTATISGITNILYDIKAGDPDSVTYYTLAGGDANNTGFKMAKVTPIRIINPNNSNYIIDQTVEYYATNLNTIEVNLPSLSVDEGNLVNIPVKIFTNGEKLGALQLALKYDTTLLDFKGIVSEEKVGNWMSFINPSQGVVEWGGYDVSRNEHLLEDQELVVTLQFLAKEPKENWTTSPLYVTRKFAGNPSATDLNIVPTDGRVSVMKSTVPNALNDESIATIMVYPNPTTGEVAVQFSIPSKSQTSVAFYDMLGKKQYVVVESVMPKGIYTYKANIGNLSLGTYNAILKTGELSAYNRVILN
jgi:hypothetical protein